MTVKTSHSNEHFTSLLFAGDVAQARIEALKGVALSSGPDARLRWLCDLSQTEWAAGDPERALAVLEGAYALYAGTQSEFHKAIYETSRGMALEYLNPPRWVEAETCYRKALERFEGLRDKRFIAPAANNLGCALTNLGRPDEALGYLKLAESIYEELGDKARLVDVADSILRARVKGCGGRGEKC